MTRHPFELSEAVTAIDHAIGPEHAPATLVEYGDFECPNCRQAAPAVRLLVQRHAGQLRLVYRHFPLEGVHPHALLAAEAAECAAAQDRFWAMHDTLFEHQLQLGRHLLSGHARRLQLDMARFEAELEDHIYLQRVREHQRSGSDSGVRGTPTFYLNGRLQDVSFGLRSLSDAVALLLEPR